MQLWGLNSMRQKQKNIWGLNGREENVREIKTATLA